MNRVKKHYSPVVDEKVYKVNHTFDGKGRTNTEEEVDQILDYYILSGEFPKGTTPRMCNYYSHHRRLEERRKVLATPKTNRTKGKVVSIKRRKSS